MYPIFILLLILIFYVSPVAASQKAAVNVSAAVMAKAKPEEKTLTKKQLIRYRKLFNQAIDALENKNTKLFNNYLKKLKNYPLSTYLHYKKLRAKLSRAKNKEIRQFLNHYSDTPYADIIRKKWLDKLAKNKKWSSYLTFYTPQHSVRRQCYYLTALIKNNKKKEAFRQVESIWLSAKSQPKTCDFVFETWEDAGYINDDLRWQRILLAMTAGRVGLAKYIAKPMSKAEKAVLSEWIKVHRKPKKLLSTKILSGKHKMKSNIVLHAIKRLARKKPEQAVDLFTAVNKKRLLTEPDLVYQAYRAIGLSFARKHKQGGWYWLSKIPDTEADVYTQEWRARAAIREQNYKAILTSITRLPKEKQQTQRWQYWQAKALIALNRNNTDKQKAEEILQKLSLQRGYYAFLAADELGREYAFNDKPIDYDVNKFVQIKKIPGIQRAREFFYLGMRTEAQREWYFVTHEVLDQQQNIIAAKLAQSWGWHDRAIITIAKTSERDDIRLRFPLMLEKSVEKYSQLNQLDEAYTYAVIRRESAFAVEARSPVGAMGLMQIMPATGKQVARKLKLPFRSKKQLYSTDFNLKLGTNYLQTMLNKFYQQPVLASAAYNAGGHRVKKWLPENKSIHAIDWVESIPFKETREYVSAILAYTAIYQHRLGKPVTRLTHRMPDVPVKQ